MSHRAILDVALRLLGLYFLVQALLVLPSFLFGLFERHSTFSGAVLFAGSTQFIVFLLSSLLLLLRSGRLADLGAGEGLDGSPIADAARLPAVVFSAAGVLIGALAVSDIFAPLLFLFTATAADEDVRSGLRYSEWARLAAGVLQVVLGVFLFLSGPRLARFWAGRAQRTG